jgi:hypothetical protein
MYRKGRPDVLGPDPLLKPAGKAVSTIDHFAATASFNPASGDGAAIALPLALG